MVEYKNKNSLLKSLLGSISRASAPLAVAAFALGSMSSLDARTADRVLVIDEGVDLFHFKLKNRAHINTKEYYGNARYDDDQNGFVDDVSGWNLLSNDNAYFPAHVRKVFNENESTVDTLLGLYNRIEDGDEEAIEYVYSDEKIAGAMSWVLGKSHGTHVAGIVQKYGNANAIISSANIFTSNDTEGTQSHTMAAPALTDGEERFLEGLKKLEERASNNVAPQSEILPQLNEARDTVFDDNQGVEQYVAESNKADRAEKLLTSRYLKTTGARVVNLSLGFAKQSWKMNLDAMWKKALREQGLPSTTPMTYKQQANYNKLLSIFDNAKQNWSELFGQNPNVLFVVAAGNDGNMRGLDGRELPSAGDNSIYEVTPANNSANHGNVITVAATTAEGVIADFSNYNSRYVNLGAYGVAVPSLAPDNNFVKMSGTSMASPFVAGVASAMFSANPALTAAQAKYILLNTTDAKASLQGKVTSNGMVNRTRAIETARRVAFFGDVEIAAEESFNPQALSLDGLFDLGSDSFTRVVDMTQLGQVFKTNKGVQKFLR